MLELQAQHITDIFVLVDDALPKAVRQPQGGRPPRLSDSEVITALVWNTLVVPAQTLKDIHRWITIDHQSDFPQTLSYSAFAAACHRAVPALLTVLERLLQVEAPLRIVDGTMLPVCKNHRANHYQVAKALVAWGKNHQGWHFGFKLHAAVDLAGQLCSLAFTPANVHEAQVLPDLVNQHTRLVVGDTAYNAKRTKAYLWQTTGTLVITPAWPKQNRSLLAQWQQALLALRSGIEARFDQLKEHLHLVSSFPRSATGYLLHYLRILLGYQVMALMNARR